MKQKAANDFETVRKLMNEFPGIDEGKSWGMPAFRVKNKMLARLNEDGESLAIKCADRDQLLESQPKVFHITKHYLNYPMVLVRFAKARPAVLRRIIEDAWRRAASPKLVKLFDSGKYEPAPLAASSVSVELGVSKRVREEQLERVRRICLALPEAEEKEAWGAPTFRVKGKLFAMFVNNHHGDGRIALWLHAPAGMQSVLVEAEPVKFFVPPYVGTSGWIGVHLDKNSDEEVAFHARQAYRMVVPKKLRG